MVRADRLPCPAVTDVDGNSEDRSDTVSVLNGPPPIIRSHMDESEGIRAIAKWVAGCAEADLQEVYDTERHLLYVACTRARDHLLVTSVEPASEFLDDMRSP